MIITHILFAGLSYIVLYCPTLSYIVIHCTTMYYNVLLTCWSLLPGLPLALFTC